MNLRKILMVVIPVIVLGVMMLGFSPTHHINLAPSVQAAGSSNCFGSCTPVPSGPTCLGGGTMPTGLVPFGTSVNPASGVQAGVELFGRPGCDVSISLVDFEFLDTNSNVGVTIYDVAGTSNCNSPQVRNMFTGYVSGTTSKPSDRISLGNAQTPIMWSNPGDSVCVFFDAPVSGGNEAIFVYSSFI